MTHSGLGLCRCLPSSPHKETLTENETNKVFSQQVVKVTKSTNKRDCPLLYLILSSLFKLLKRMKRALAERAKQEADEDPFLAVTAAAESASAAGGGSVQEGHKKCPYLDLVP